MLEGVSATPLLDTLIAVGKKMKKKKKRKKTYKKKKKRKKTKKRHNSSFSGRNHNKGTSAAD